MKVPSAAVLLGAALLCAPALWHALTGEAWLDVVLARYLVAVLLCWAGVSVVKLLVGPVPARAAVPRRDGVDSHERAGGEHAGVSAG